MMNNSDYKKDLWQFHSNAPTEDREIVIGFDFGTACSKVVLQDRQTRQAFAVSFGELGCQGNSYLIPSWLYIKNNGHISLKSEGKLLKNIKIRCIEKPDTPIARVKSNGDEISIKQIGAAYIALVLKEVRAWFFQQKAQDYRHVKIEWQLNIGMPSRSYDDENLCDLMKQMALTGWNLTLNHKAELSALELDRARQKALIQLGKNSVESSTEQLHPDNVNPVPEIIAEVIGYAHSQLRHDGMYFLADIGASTLDVSTFILSEKEEEDSYTILCADVQKMGAYRLHLYRIKEISNLMREKIERLNSSCDGIAPLPDYNEYIPRISEDDEKTIYDANLEYMTECSRLLRSVIRETKTRRNPLAAEWQHGIPVFLCGGGSQAKLYQTMLEHAGEQLKTTDFGGFLTKKLPRPDNLESEGILPQQCSYRRSRNSYRF